MFKLAVVGSRTYTDRATVFLLLDEYLRVYGNDLTLVSGGCPKGPDRYAEEYATSRNVPIIIFYPDWDLHGKAAGFIRNASIVSECNEVIAFWDNKSNGTRDTINRAKKQGKEVIIVESGLTFTEKCFKVLSSNN